MKTKAAPRAIKKIAAALRREPACPSDKPRPVMKTDEEISAERVARYERAKPKGDPTAFATNLKSVAPVLFKR